MKQNGNWVDRLEKKLGKYAIPNLMKYMTVLYIIGFLLSWVSPYLFVNLLALDFGMILKGQVWRLVTFLINPPQIFGGMTSLIFILFAIHLYYFIGTTLEAVWGTFKFNLFYFGGLLACVACSLVSYLLFGIGYGFLISTDYIFLSMFLAYAILFPNNEFVIYFILPIKVKWLGLIDALGLAFYTFVFAKGALIDKDAESIVCLMNILFSIINFVVMFKAFKHNGVSAAQRKKSKEYKKKVNTLSKNRVHTCTTCGATSKTHPDMEFRFCSRCDGNREYCTEHLFTHEHIKKIIINIDKDEN